MVGLGGGAQGNGDSLQDGERRTPAIPATFFDTEIFVTSQRLNTRNFNRTLLQETSFSDQKILLLRRHSPLNLPLTSSPTSHPNS